MSSERGAQVVCGASGWDWPGAPLAAANYADGKSHQETLGFVKLEDIETTAAKVWTRSGFLRREEF
jgi:hypothetical protein